MSPLLVIRDVSTAPVGTEKCYESRVVMRARCGWTRVVRSGMRSDCFVLHAHFPTPANSATIGPFRTGEIVDEETPCVRASYSPGRRVR
jgi:hypothetical protein